ADARTCRQHPGRARPVGTRRRRRCDRGGHEDGERVEGTRRRRGRTHSRATGRRCGEGCSAARARVSRCYLFSGHHPCTPIRPMSRHLNAERARWEEETLRPVLEKYPERADRFQTTSGIEIERVYDPASTAIDYCRDLGYPGEFPFTRGVQPTMYRGRLWTMRQYAGFGTAAQTNER